jgi:ATP/maltotriose-dependent transcriptional regulator MalT
VNVIQTKLSPPPSRPGTVERRQLLDALDRAGMCKLTLVSAPAGFGKTTLLAQWYRSAAARGAQCAWLGLGHDDNEPLRFLRCVIETGRANWPGFGAAARRRVEAAAPADIAEVLPEFIGDLGHDRTQRLLFIDDVHHAAHPAITQFFELLCNLTPPGFHLVLAGRVRPPLPLASLRVRGELREVTASQLRFDRTEAEHFLRAVHGIDLTPAQMDSLHAHSEGWVAGLQLASLSLREQPSPDEFIAAFSGNLRDVAEYLAGDVLDKQPEDVRGFLLRTCILDRFDAGACAALTGIGRAQDVLETLEDQNLFLLPLDGERRWYRYHQLFQEFLQGQLRRRHPGEIVDLYRRAADWFDREGLAAEAVEYALLSGDIQRAVALIEPQMQQEIMAGRMPRVSDWIDRIPERDRNASPRLLKAKGTALYHMNRPEAAAEITDSLQRLEGGNSPNVRLLRAGIAICRDDIDAALCHLEGLPADMSRFDLGTMHNIRGYAEAELARYGEARASLQRARAHHLAQGSSFGVVYADCFLGLVDLAQGNLAACYERFDAAALPGGTAETYVAPVPAVMRGLVLYEWARPMEALALLRTGVPLLEQVGHIKLLTLGRLALGKLALRDGDWDHLHHHFDRCLELGEARGAHLARLQSLVESERIRMLVGGGLLDEARRRARAAGLDPDAPGPAPPDRWDRATCLNLLSWCRLQIGAGNARASQPVLERLLELARAAGRRRRMLECLVVDAVGRDAAGDARGARRALSDALGLAAPGRQLMVFLDEGTPLRALLLRVAPPQSPVAADLLQQLRAISGEPGLHTPLIAPAGHAVRSGEFSAREREILRHVADGASNSVIADALQISENTVKWHLKNLYQKLAVKNRTAAAAAARRMHWVA